MRPFTYMYACLVCSLSSHSPSPLPLRQPRAHRRPAFSFFFSPSNYHSKEDIFLSNLGIMLFQVWVMNKLVQTLRVSELMQKKTTDWWWVGVVGVWEGGKEQHQVNRDEEYEHSERCLDLLGFSPQWVHRWKYS